MNQTTPKRQTSQNDTLVEQLRGLGSGMAKTITHDVVGGMATDAVSSLFGTAKSGDLQPGQSVNLNKPTPVPRVDTAPSTFPKTPERFPFPFKRKEQFKPLYSMEQMAQLRQQEQEIVKKIDEIRMELKQLIAEVKDVSSDIVQSVDSQLVDPDTYHMNFFDRIKVMLKNALKQIRESRTWMQTQKSKKKQMGYWSQYKKKGTMFGLSHERSVSTQVG